MKLSRSCTLAAGLAILTVLTACTTSQRHAWLTVFFEGVPPLEGEGPLPAADAAQVAKAGTSPGTVRLGIQWYIHKPFKERKCGTCHGTGESQVLTGTQRQMCYPCHTNVLSGLAGQHWPAQKWKCAACHTSHKSTVAKLLKQPIVPLCNECHVALNTSTFVHRPVQMGRCLFCHPAHEAPYPGLLRNSGDDLCRRCHYAGALAAAKGHVGARLGQQACIKCHDPHESNKKGLLK
jgi:predicted CXXCH cytochrome family protein